MKFSQAGIAVLEATIVLLLLISILLAGWGVIDLFHQGMSLEDLVESNFYDGAIGLYRNTRDGEGSALEINREELARYLQQKVDSIGNELLAKNGSSDSFFVQGAIIELIWREHESPRIARISPSRVSGGLSGAAKSGADIVQLAYRFINEMADDESRRIGFVRPALFRESHSAGSLFQDRFILVGINAGIAVGSGPVRFLLEGIHGTSRVERSSFNIVRKDL